MAAVLILLVILALAVAAILEANDSDHHARLADLERVRAEKGLWNASLAQARSERLSGDMGHRSRGLVAIEVAANLRPDLELRNEAIAALARGCQVLMAVPNPCRHYWADLIPDRELLLATRRRQALPHRRPHLDGPDGGGRHRHARRRSPPRRSHHADRRRAAARRGRLRARGARSRRPDHARQLLRARSILPSAHLGPHSSADARAIAA